MALNDSINFPNVELYNSKGAFVASYATKKEIGELSPGVGIVSFKYKYDDEDDDECTIKIQANHPKWIDQLPIELDPELGLNQYLFVRWGYVKGNFTHKKTIVLRDIKSSYGSTELWVELTCTDVATYLKLTRSPFTSTISPIEYIRQFCSGKLDVVIKHLGIVIYRQGINEKTSELDEFSVTVNPEEATLEQLSKLEKPALGYKKTGEIEVPIGKWFTDKSNPVRQFLEKEREINTINQSPHTIIAEIMELAPYGPWYVTGREGSIIIHNRYLSSGVYKNYGYLSEPGDLVEFIPETKFENYIKRTVSYAGMDPNERAAMFLDAYLDKLFESRGAKSILEDNNLSDKEKQKQLNDWVSLYKNGYQTFRTLRNKVEMIRGGLVFPVDNWSPTTRKELNPQDNTLAPINPLVPNQSSQNIDMDPLYVIQRGFHYVTPLTDMSESKNMVENATRKMEMEKQEAKLVVIGDPSLRNDINISISGVQDIHAGTYYIKACEHEITQSGYRTTCDVFKVTSNANIKLYEDNKFFETETSMASGEPTTTIKSSLKSRYYKEEEVFRKWNILPVIAKKQYGNSGSSMLGIPKTDMTLDITQEFDEFLENYPDSPADELIKRYNEGSVKFKESNTEER